MGKPKTEKGQREGWKEETRSKSLGTIGWKSQGKGGRREPVAVEEEGKEGKRIQ